MKIKPTYLAAAIATAITSGLTHASSIRDDIDLQVYRDFAENKGEFVAGATDILIKDKKGNAIGTLLPAGVPMPDFSAANTQSGVVTLLTPQLTGTVQHNPTYVLLNQNHHRFSAERNRVWAGELAAQDLKMVYDGLSFGANDNHFAPKNRYFVSKRNDFEHDLDAHTQHYHRYPEGTDLSKVIKTDGEPDYFAGTADDFWGEYSNGNVNDMALPRLHKMVTEVAPTNLIPDYGTFSLADYAVFAHVGSGILETIDPKTGDGKKFVSPHFTHLSDLGDNTFVHQFLTASLVPKLQNELEIRGSRNNHEAGNTSIYMTSKPFNYTDFYRNDSTNPTGSVLAGSVQAGDSGSGLYGYNTKTQQWVFLGFVQGGTGDTNGELRRDRAGNYIDTYTSLNPYFSALQSYNDGVDAPRLSNLIWRQARNNTNSTLGSTTIEKHKDLYIDTNGTITLATDIDQKSGGIYVGTTSPTNLTIKGDHTHTGGGIYVGEGSQVDYQVGIKEHITVYPQLGQTTEYLAKLGDGTLTISGAGNNLGGISVGDGTVILNKEGQAAGFVELAGGHGQVVINRNNQVKNNDYRFGHRGGTLDLNGHSIETNYLHNVDDGGVIINQNAVQDAILTWRSVRPFDFGQDDNGIYAVIGDGNLERTNKPDDVNYLSLGTTQAEAERLYQDGQGIRTAFAGSLGHQDATGNLDVIFNPINNHGTWLLTGGAHLRQLNAHGGSLILAGRPTPRAFDHINRTDFDANKNSWIERSYHADTITANNDAKVISARGAALIQANLSATDNAGFDIGFLPNSNDKLCVRSDYNGLIECKPLNPTAEQNHQVRTTLQGDINLSQNAYARLTGTNWTGDIQGTKDTALNLDQSTWQMTGDSTVGAINLQDAQIRLGQEKDKLNTLTIQGDLAGTSDIYYRTHIKELTGDKVIVHGETTGNHTLHINNSGLEPAAADSKLNLIETLGGQNDLMVRLATDAVDLGAYRYTLGNDEAAFYLYNPELDAKKAQEEAERLAKEAEEKRLAEEKAKAEQAERERLEAERKEAEKQAELARIEAERLEAERLAKEAEEKRLAEEKAKAEQAERERLEAEHLETEKARLAQEEAERLEAERLEAERLAKEAEEKRLAEEKAKAEQAERERLEAERLEAEKARLAQEEAERLARIEAERLEAERLEAERKEAERQAELARIEAERLEAERLAKEAEEKRLAEEKAKAEQAERERLEAERLEAEKARLAQEEAERLARIEAERLEAERLEAERKEAERQAELARIEAERLEAERLAKEAEEKRLAEEKAKAEQAERERLEAERLEAEKARLAQEEAERLARIEAERLEAERLEAERKEAERQAELARIEAERLEAERLAKEAEEKRLAEEKAKAEQAERERLEAEHLETEKARLAQEEAERLEAERLEAERLAKEAEEKRLAEEKAKAEQAERERLEAERLEAEKARLAQEEAERLARIEAERLEAERLEAERKEAERQAELARIEAERLEAERLAKEAEEKRLAEEKAKAEQAERERLEAERLEAEKARLAQEEAERLARIEAERLEAERLEAERKEAERQAELARIEAERLEAERLAKEAEEKRLAEEAEKARLAQEEAERLAREQAEAERLEAERLAQEAKEKAERLARELATRKQNELISRYSNTAISEIAATTQGLLTIGQARQHLLDEQTQPVEVWLDNQWTNAAYQSDLHRGYQQKSHLLQVGIDKQLDDHNNWRGGILVSQLKADNQFDQASSKNNIRQVTGYIKHQANSGAFGAFEMGAAKIDSQISINGGKTNIERDAAFVGVLTGINHQGIVNVKPHAGMRAYRYSDAAYSLEQAQVTAQASNIINAYAGIEINKPIIIGNSIIHPSFSTTFNHHHANFDVKVNNHQIKQEIGNQINHELALKWQVANRLTATLRTGVTHGKEIDRQRYGGIQMKMEW